MSKRKPSIRDQITAAPLPPVEHRAKWADLWGFLGYPDRAARLVTEAQQGLSTDQKGTQ